MFKRVTWFGVGVVVGAGGTAFGYVRARQLARRHVPESVQDATTRAARRAEEEASLLAQRAASALDDWRSTAERTRHDRARTEALLRDQLEQAGL